MNQRKLGIIFSYLSTGANVLIGLIYIPLLLHFLTKQQYGLYQLMGSLIAYLSIMDFGLSNTTTRYFTQALTLKDKKLQQEIISSSLTIYNRITVVLVLLGISFYFLLPPLYSKALTADELHTAKQIFLLLLLNITIFIPSNIFVAVINAHEKFVFLKGINLLKIIIQPILACAILYWKSDVLYLVLVQTFFTLAVILLNYLYCHIKLKISFTRTQVNKAIIKELTGFSIFVFLHSLLDQVYWRSGQIILGSVSGTTAVANYSIIMQLSLFTVMMPIGLSNVFLPKLSAIVVQKNNLEEINKIFCKLGRLQFIFVCLLLAGFIFLGPTFLILWIGPGYEICYWASIIIMAGYTIDVIQNVGIAILQAMKKHAFRAYVYLFMTVFNLSLSIYLGRLYGEIGCALSTAICLILGPGLTINWYYHHIGIDLKNFFSNIWQLLFPILLSILLTFLVQKVWPVIPQWDNFILHGVLFTGIYATTMWLLGMNDYEKELILNPLKKYIFHK